MDDEAKLIILAKNGDAGAFDNLLDIHLPRLFSVCLKLVGRREDAEDCLQEASLRIYRSLSSFRGDSRFGTWASRIAMNCCYDFLRSSKGRYEVALEIETEDGPYERILADPAPTQDVIVEQAEMAELVRQAALSVREPFRTVLIEIDLLGHSYEDVAKKQGIALGTVKSRLSRARALAGEFLKRNEESQTKTQTGTKTEALTSKKRKEG
jgi:RNA polymerase sigma-70 factor (ECF subfamily)